MDSARAFGNAPTMSAGARERRRAGSGPARAAAVLVLVACGSGDHKTSEKSAEPVQTPASASAPSAAPKPLPAALPIPAGTRPRCTFANAETVSCEGPAITVAAFELDATEVTIEAYSKCVREGACDTVGLDAEHSCNFAAEKRGRTAERIGQHPVNCVTFSQAKRFCEQAGKRLPTRDEWEYAARGADGRIYPWGSTAPRWASSSTELGVWACWRHAGTCEVGTFPPRQAPFELRDMAGNVAEWTAEGVACGSSWLDPELDVTEMVALARCRPDKGRPDPTIGFRCARSI